MCFGARNIDRLSYKVWEDVVPQVIIELTSASTKYMDLGEKKGVYEVRGVEEYYLWLKPKQRRMRPKRPRAQPKNGR